MAFGILTTFSHRGRQHGATVFALFNPNLLIMVMTIWMFRRKNDADRSVTGRLSWRPNLWRFVPKSLSPQAVARSGLGIEGQRATVTRFAEAESLTILAEFAEIQTGKGADALDRRLSSQLRLPSLEQRNAAYWSPSWIGCPAMLRSSRG